MPRDGKARTNALRARALKTSGLARNELRVPTSPRVSAAGPTAMAVKAREPEVERMVEAFMAGRQR